MAEHLAVLFINPTGVICVLSCRLQVWQQWSPQCDLISITWMSMSEIQQLEPLLLLHPLWAFLLCYPSWKLSVKAKSPGRPGTLASRLYSRLLFLWVVLSCLISGAWLKLLSMVSSAFPDKVFFAHFISGSFYTSVRHSDSKVLVLLLLWYWETFRVTLKDEERLIVVQYLWKKVNPFYTAALFLLIWT